MNFETVETIGSTSEALKARLSATPGLEETALLARRQTGGRGQLGRRWESPPGNLYLSVLLRPGRIRSPGHWSIMVGVVVAEAVAALLPEPGKLRLKWPNDVLLEGRKLAGILLESGDDGAPWLLIGIGVNLHSAPELPDRETAALVSAAPPPEPETLAQDIIARLEVWRGRYVAEGFEPIRLEWLEWGPAEGDRVVARVGDRKLEGVFAGLALSGAMRIDTPTGPRTILAAEF